MEPVLVIDSDIHCEYASIIKMMAMKDEPIVSTAYVVRLSHLTQMLHTEVTRFATKKSTFESVAALRLPLPFVTTFLIWTYKFT